MYLETKNLTTGYEKKVIISNMNIKIQKRKINIIIGSNGCGKSTLLKNLARLYKPMKGEITLGSKNIFLYEGKEFARLLGLLPQSPTVPEGIKVFDLVTRGRFPYRKFMSNLKEEDYEAVNRALSIVGIDDLANSNIDELSGGQRQRVWIALALAQDTDILLLDEPTTYLDIQYQVEILDLLFELNKSQGTTIVMVLHDINLSSRYGDYIFALKKGKLIAEGRPKDIITKELMKEIYNLDCIIIEDPLTASPLIIPRGKHSHRYNE